MSPTCALMYCPFMKPSLTQHIAPNLTMIYLHPILMVCIDVMIDWVFNSHNFDKSVLN